MAAFFRRGVFLLAALLTLATIWTHEAYVLQPGHPELVRLAPIRWWLWPHIAGGTLALLIGPLQFSATLRRRNLTLHRWLGRTYAAAVLLSSVLSLWIVFTFELPANHWVMGAMGGLWLLCTVFAWMAARGGRIDQHKLWMARSYGLTFTFVATRFVPDLILPGMDYINTTALYWAFIVLSLVVPDLIYNGSALLPRKRPAA